jgi:nitric oxide reductase large subunit
MKQKLLSFLIFWFYFNGRPKTRLGYIAQPLLAIMIMTIVIFILNSLFPSCKAMLKTKNEFLRISENKKALEVEADMKRGNCPK